ncbi:MAG: PASTA domain-containing protein [candidate division KSB1 bacterium]|nr:PASTA domain-containing protein [candidate division KSB1 bacterium]MDZ7333774.1 PASTA domain-containing protein [candidate division KSB1 bacterium]MDZ7357553.1 PASTA domain-containing protein [candidate division KSB1 bacterium]MDZ7400534.1 PASTA domain-containing protein [candidate division KSB1 bacterium]
MIPLKDLDWNRIAKAIGKIFIGLLLFYLIIDKIVMPLYTRHGQSITVPDLTNLFYEDARELLDRLDLKIVEEAKKFDSKSEFPIGTIMSQNPRPGATVKKGRRIYVIVSKGEPTVTMPRLIGESERNAIFMLENLDLTVGKIYYEPSDSSNYLLVGKVVAQSIPAGSEVKIGTTVNFTVISNAELVVVPDLVGMNLTDAQRVIANNGLSVGEIFYEEKSDLLPETVIDQFPRAKEQVPRGELVRLWVSSLPGRD